MSLTMILFGIVAGLVTLVYYKMKQAHRYWQKSGIACEEPTFLLGNMTGAAVKRNFADIWSAYYERFKGTGPFAGFYWFQRPAVFVLDPSLMKNILIKDFTKFANRNFYTNERDDPLSGHLFLLQGERWSAMRKKLSPTFTSGKMKFMFPTVLKVAEEFVKVFDEVLAKDSIVEVRDMLARYTTDVIGTCAFGIDCNSLKDPDVEFRVMGRKSMNPKRHGVLGIAFMNSFPNIGRKLRMAIFEDELQEFFLRIVRETVKYREQNGIRRNDFMDMLINLKNNKSSEEAYDVNDLETLTLEQMTAQAFVFFAAGYETSSTTMGFALYELARQEDIQDRLRAEVNTVLAQHNHIFSYECMKDMRYLEQVISETLRIYTVLPVLNRECLEDYVVPDNPKFVIKKGMPILIPIGAVHRDPEYFPNPEVFNPDHFTHEKVQERDHIIYQPFGEGPRNCIGMRFGQMQMRIGLALLLKHFKFSVCPQTQIPMQYDFESFLVSAKKGIFLQVQRV